MFAFEVDRLLCRNLAEDRQELICQSVPLVVIQEHAVARKFDWVSTGDDDEEQYPRRASGETLGVAATGRLGRFDVLAQFVRWDSRYGDGAGVYVLAQQS